VRVAAVAAALGGSAGEEEEDGDRVEGARRARRALRWAWGCVKRLTFVDVWDVARWRERFERIQVRTRGVGRSCRGVGCGGCTRQHPLNAYPPSCVVGSGAVVARASTPSTHTHRPVSWGRVRWLHAPAPPQRIPTVLCRGVGCGGCTHQHPLNAYPPSCVVFGAADERHRALGGARQQHGDAIRCEGSSLSPGKKLHHQRSSSSHDASPHPQGERPAKDPLNSAFLDTGVCCTAPTPCAALRITHLTMGGAGGGGGWHGTYEQTEGVHTLPLGWLVGETVMPWLAPLVTALVVLYVVIIELLPACHVSYETAAVAYCGFCVVVVAARLAWTLGRMGYQVCVRPTSS
jgi:hypothetical protein